jgi:hypothetical protein
MSYVYINLFNKGSQAELNPDEPIVRLQERRELLSCAQ